MAAHGAEGSLRWDWIGRKVILDRPNMKIESWKSRQTIDDLFSEQLRAFLEARDGTPDERLADADDGMRALSVCDAARASDRNRRETEVQRP